jgi:predicted ATPase
VICISGPCAFSTIRSLPRSVTRFCLDVFRKTERLDFSGTVTFFIGENGSGKSTLLQAIARACSIHIWEEHEGRRDPANLWEDRLHQSIRLDWTDANVTGSFFASEIFRHFAEVLDTWKSADAGCLDYYGTGSPVLESHGQSPMSFLPPASDGKGCTCWTGRRMRFRQ